jgi:hypothetical protein
MYHNAGRGTAGRWGVIVGRDFYRQGDDLLIRATFGDGSEKVVRLEFDDWRPGTLPAAMTLAGNIGRDESDVMDFLQAVVDAAADFGVVAKGARDTAKELSAVRYHLEDMRRLAIGERTVVGDQRFTVRGDHA